MKITNAVGTYICASCQQYIGPEQDRCDDYPQGKKHGVRRLVKHNIDFICIYTLLFRNPN